MINKNIRSGSNAKKEREASRQSRYAFPRITPFALFYDSCSTFPLIYCYISSLDCIFIFLNFPFYSSPRYPSTAKECVFLAALYVSKHLGIAQRDACSLLSSCLSFVSLDAQVISTAEVGVIENWGRFSRLAQPGLGVIIWPMDSLVGKLSFRVQQLNVRVETKTLDNVFITAVVSVQYQILREKVYEAFYALTNPAQQITAHVYDVMRSQLPNLELDSVFEAKEELALAVKNALAETMTGYGYSINNVLITDLDPDVRVKVRECLLLWWH